MMHRTSTTAERPSYAMGAVAVAIGVGYGVVDTIARHVHDRGHHGVVQPPVTPLVGAGSRPS